MLQCLRPAPAGPGTSQGLSRRQWTSQIHAHAGEGTRPDPAPGAHRDCAPALAAPPWRRRRGPWVTAEETEAPQAEALAPVRRGPRGGRAGRNAGSPDGDARGNSSRRPPGTPPRARRRGEAGAGYLVLLPLRCGASSSFPRARRSPAPDWDGEGGPSPEPRARTHFLVSAPNSLLLALQRAFLPSLSLPHPLPGAGSLSLPLIPSPFSFLLDPFLPSLARTRPPSSFFLFPCPLCLSLSPPARTGTQHPVLASALS